MQIRPALLTIPEPKSEYEEEDKIYWEKLGIERNWEKALKLYRSFYRIRVSLRQTRLRSALTDTHTERERERERERLGGDDTVEISVSFI